MENRKTRKEFMEELKNTLIGAGIIVGSVVSVVAAVYCHRELKKCTRMMNEAVKSVSDIAVVDVQQGIIDHAITNAANREVGRVVSRTVQNMSYDLKNETQKKVSEAVKTSYNQLRKVVSDAIAKEASKIDQSQIMEEATEKAKEILLERFDGKLDGLMSDYQRNLDNVGKIYQSIASSMAERSGKDVTLKVG